MFKIRKYIAKISRRFSSVERRAKKSAKCARAQPREPMRWNSRNERKKKSQQFHSHTHIIYDCVSFFSRSPKIPLLCSTHFAFGLLIQDAFFSSPSSSLSPSPLCSLDKIHKKYALFNERRKKRCCLRNVLNSFSQK